MTIALDVEPKQKYGLQLGFPSPHPTLKKESHPHLPEVLLFKDHSGVLFSKENKRNNYIMHLALMTREDTYSEWEKPVKAPNLINVVSKLGGGVDNSLRQSKSKQKVGTLLMQGFRTPLTVIIV